MVGMSTVKQKSPSVQKRDRLRMLVFNLKKKEAQFSKEKILLNRTIQELQDKLKLNSLIKSKPKLTILNVSSQSISPKPKPMLSIMNVLNYDIPPRPKSCTQNSYHPHIIEACRLMYGKPPDQLSPEEAEHFNGYQEYKIHNGLPIEEDILYKPA